MACAALPLGTHKGCAYSGGALRQVEGRRVGRLRAGDTANGSRGLGRTLPAVAWLPCATLPLGTHKGHPYRGRADRGAATALGRAHHERRAARPEEAGLRPARTKEQDAKAGDWLGDLLLAVWFDTAQHERFRALGIVG